MSNQTSTAGCSIGCLGCALDIVGVVAFLFAITHVTEIWNFFESVFR